ncbi:MAG TPA: ferredoxin reductase [Streptosporangiaceae bacterium]|nr:ferredoxin reductase [Streptosporangiaceae bacterium]
MARAAVLGRLTWRVAMVAAVRDETPTARTLMLAVPGWPGHRPGQHVDVRLTAPDGYSAQRSYSIASAAGHGELASSLELTVQWLADGEVSPYLTQTLAVGDPLELRGPIGGWFVWDPDDPGPVLLVAGGSGIVPLMAMIRARALAGRRSPFRLIYSVRDPGAALYAAELAERAQAGDGLTVSYVYTRAAPAGSGLPTGRISGGIIAAAGFPPGQSPAVFVCGPTGFVEAAADLLTGAGHDPRAIRTERFGPSGGQS